MCVCASVDVCGCLNSLLPEIYLALAKRPRLAVSQSAKNKLLAKQTLIYMHIHCLRLGVLQCVCVFLYASQWRHEISSASHTEQNDANENK